MLEYADDTAMLGLISDTNGSLYLLKPNTAYNWGHNNNHLLNEKKTKEIFPLRKCDPSYTPVIPGHTPAGRVDKFTYLGTTTGAKLSWSYSNSVTATIQQRLYFLRLLITIKIDNTIFQLL